MLYTNLMRRPNVSRRWYVAGAFVLGFIALAVIALALVFPRLGAYMIRQRLSGRLAGKLPRFEA